MARMSLRHTSLGHVEGIAGAIIRWQPGDIEAHIEGHFTPDELRALADHMDEFYMDEREEEEASREDKVED